MKHFHYLIISCTLLHPLSYGMAEGDEFKMGKGKNRDQQMQEVDLERGTNTLNISLNLKGLNQARSNSPSSPTPRDTARLFIALHAAPEQQQSMWQWLTSAISLGQPVVITQDDVHHAEKAIATLPREQHQIIHEALTARTQRLSPASLRPAPTVVAPTPAAQPVAPAPAPVAPVIAAAASTAATAASAPAASSSDSQETAAQALADLAISELCNHVQALKTTSEADKKKMATVLGGLFTATGLAAGSGVTLLFQHFFGTK